MTTPSNRVAPLIGNRDRDTDPAEIIVPPRGGGGVPDVAELDAHILAVVEAALAAGLGTVPPPSPYDAEALKQLLGYLGGVEVGGSTRPNQTPTVADVRRYFPTLALGAAAPQLGVIVGRADGHETRITAVETKNTQQDTRIASLESAGAATALAIFGVADTAWTACTKAAGMTETLWVRVWKGRVIFKSGSTAASNPVSFLTGRITSTSSFTTVATLPASIPKPGGNNTDWYSAISTYQQGAGTPYGTGQLVVYGSSGNIGVVTGHVPMDGFYPHSIAGYPIGA